MFLPIFPIPVRTGLTTTHRYPLENGFTTDVMNPLLKLHIARLKGSIGSLKPDGRTMEFWTAPCATVCSGELDSVSATGCAEANSQRKQPNATNNGSLI